MTWTLTLIISGLFAFISGICFVRYGNQHFRMRHFWIFLGSFGLAIISIFCLPFYVASAWWLIAGCTGLIPVWRAFKHRNDVIKPTYGQPKLKKRAGVVDIADHFENGRPPPSEG